MIADEGVAQRIDLHGGGRPVWMPCGDPARNLAQLPLCRLERHAAFQSRDYGVPRTTALGGIGCRHRPASPVGERQPEVGAAREVEGRRHHPDDRERAASERIDLDRPADDRCIAVELRVPVPVTDDDGPKALRAIGVGAQPAANERWDTHRGKKARRCEDAGDAFHVIARDDVEDPGLAGPVRQRPDRLERRRLGGPIHEVRRRHPLPRARCVRFRPPDRHETMRLREWQRPEEHGPYRTEHRCRRADAERERGDDQRRQTGLRMRLRQAERKSISLTEYSDAKPHRSDDPLRYLANASRPAGRRGSWP